MASNTDEPKSRTQTGFWLNNELEVQKFWDENKVFEADPGSEPPRPGQKFFENFPYPYMNGSLHLGHAFSSSKFEFGADDEPKSHARTGFLLNNESEVQKFWDENKVFEADSGSEPPNPVEKFFGNFPYPYMISSLHLGHAFSLSKLEFGADQRLRGFRKSNKKVSAGMLIKALR